MVKVVKNATYGGFSLSWAVFDELRKMGNAYALSQPDGSYKSPYWLAWDIERDDPQLITVIEKLGLEKAAGTSGSVLEIVDVPDGINWTILDFDGAEWVVDEDRCW